MSQTQKNVIAGIVRKYNKARHRLMDIARDVQAQYGCISDESAKMIADELGIPFIEVIDMVSFYYFLSREPKGKSVIRLSDSVVDRMSGNREVAKAFEKAVGIPFGGTTADGAITLEYTSDIGMCDQAPAALVNQTVMTKLCPEDVPKIVDRLKKGKPPGAEAKDGARPDAQVDLNLIQPGQVIFSPVERGAAVRAMANLSPEEVIDVVTQSGLRGRGGAGFPTGMKLSFCRKAKGNKHYVICNADEGEPGTFKDRVVLTEVPDLLFAGMTIAGYAIGADEGLLYLRGEYGYLLSYLEQVLARRKHLGLLGENIAGKEGFNFDIRIQMGAGAYVCGEESSLIESLEGKRGAPRDRPPFPVTKGFMNQPSAVNNVETLCCVARIIQKGADWFKAIGTKDSTGTKLLSVSGDCKHPGVYEVEFGLLVDELLELVGAVDAQAVQIGGPSGSCIAPKDFGRKICFEDLPTGGSVIVFGKDRDMLEVVAEFTEFFIEESCGWCAPCRVGTTLLKRMLEKVIEGRGTKADLADLENIGNTIKAMSRCGLGQTAANPVLTTLKNMPEIYRARLKAEEFVPPFQIDKALADGIAIAGREPVWEEEL
jgi:[NiFe] hydrogenase diaphorase moiety large subunit